MGIRCGKCKSGSGNILTAFVPGVGAVGASCIVCGNYAGSKYGFYNEPPLKKPKTAPEERTEEMPAKKIGTCSNCKRPGKRLYAHDLCGGCHQYYYVAPKGDREKGLAKARAKFMEKKPEVLAGEVPAQAHADIAGDPCTQTTPADVLRRPAEKKILTTKASGDKRQFDVHYLESRDGKMIASIKAEADNQRRGISAEVLCMLEYAIEQKMWDLKK
jgi:hypothetical protein